MDACLMVEPQRNFNGVCTLFLLPLCMNITNSLTDPQMEPDVREIILGLLRKLDRVEMNRHHKRLSIALLSLWQQLFLKTSVNNNIKAIP